MIAQQKKTVDKVAEGFCGWNIDVKTVYLTEVQYWRS